MTDVAEALSATTPNGPAPSPPNRWRSPHPLADQLPGIYNDDQFTLRLVGALDEVLAPALVALDCLSAYFDPEVAPPDFLEWVGSWIGLEMDARWPEDRRRALLRETVELYRWLGTRHGLAAHVRLHTGVEPEILEPGGVAWSETPGGALPGDDGDEVVVRVDLPGAGPAEQAALEGIVAAATPAHLAFRVEFGGGRPAPRPTSAPSRPPAEPSAGPPVGDEASDAPAEAQDADDARTSVPPRAPRTGGTRRTAPRGGKSGAGKRPPNPKADPGAQ